MQHNGRHTISCQPHETTTASTFGYTFMMLGRLSSVLLRRQYTRRCVSFGAFSTSASKNSSPTSDVWLSRVHTTKSQRDMEELGEWLARDRQVGDVLFLHGDLGCGKTCLARGFIQSYTGQKDLAVTSPTYLLVNTYDEVAELPTVYHVDLYRLDAVTEQDAVALGLAEAFERGVTLVEWPERFDEKSIPTERLNVRISYDEEDPEIRHVELQPIGERWMKLFNDDIKE
ncbi:YjeE family ATPase [Phytophthora nicotianae INRA-310]|uniref:tRNA threonylcarbamoyladenosine biosynthesis protein TsaE n=1 Tax=Phytophthora nicotianae (strain INRA-310) TaxID=761204 RepID=W2QYF6_PHYN3|nr:YjeE family ATPase [Phytophthora nicotianae INRA-310]ETN18006.1 YjeE family ATPase [Phytophthora nicotianae INRA-310]